MRYEDLVASPVRELTRFVDELELAPCVSIEEAVSANGLDALRDQTRNGHFWRGRPGLWRSLLTRPVAGELATAYADLLEPFGYEADPEPDLSAAAARTTWARLQVTPPQPLDDPAETLRVTSYVDLATAERRELVERLYRLVLRRPPDDAARERAERMLADATLSVASLLDELAGSAEARLVRAYEDAVTFARWAREADERPRGLRAPRDAPETAIAIPWALARYRNEAAVLDVGFAYAEPAYLAALVGLPASRLVGVDLAARAVPGLETIVADVRQLPLERHAFDVVFCLSTLHHVGRDNRAYGLPAEQAADGAHDALVELRRVVRPEGRILVSVPTGRSQDLGMFVQLTTDEWLALFSATDLFVVEHEVYVLDAGGWQATGGPTGELHYGARGPSASAVLCAELQPDRLGRAARLRLGQARRRLATRRAATAAQ
jgi:SAM-dependent methyltransferase